MGRAGRLLNNGERQRSMISLLFNSQDLAVKGMSEEIRALCRSKDRCLKDLLRTSFVGDYSVNLIPGSTNFCCSTCDLLMDNAV